MGSACVDVPSSDHLSSVAKLEEILELASKEEDRIGRSNNEQPFSSSPSSSEEEVDDSPIEQVRLTVPITDDPTQPVLTFRTWVLGLTACVVLSFLNQFFTYRNSFISVSSVCAQITVLPIGRLMASTLPTRPVRIPLTKWSFSMNPGPFNLKEHALITIFAGAGAGGVFAVNIITIVKAFYHRGIHPGAALLLSQTTQLLGYGWAGLFRKYLVDSPYMWWPSNLVQVSLFRALHEEEKRGKGGGLSRLQFFLTVSIVSFSYYVVPGYFFPSITALSFVCWVWKDSIVAQQIGAGYHGLGLGSISLDWATITMFAGNPLATPAFAIFNTLLGFVLIIYVLIPVSYYMNVFEARRFPMLSLNVFDADGKPYNITRIIDEESFTFDHQGYNAYSKINLSGFFVYMYGLSFAILAATLSHVALFNGRSIIKMWQQTAAKAQEDGDIHTRLMKKNYAAVPQWWFHVILVTVLGLSFLTCEGFNRQLQLPFWGILLACFMAVVFTLPIGVITATTNQMPGLNVITELVIGYMYPGRPLANVTFKTYGYISMVQALTFLGDFKLGHYMKIPPRSMFVAQLVGTIVASSVYFGTAWWLLTSIEYICEVDKLPVGSPWTCPGYDVFYSASIIWGVAGPLRMFGRLGLYSSMNYFFLIGLLAPVPIWLISRKFPEKKWIKLINVPIILSGSGGLPIAKSAGVLPWFAVAITFNVLVYRRYKNWWAKHTYVLSAGLDAGIAFFAILSFFALQSHNINGLDWWGAPYGDHCPLATCPTAPGIVVEGCPVL